MIKAAPGPCRNEARENIPWYVNGTLSGAAVAELREHIRDCKYCQADLETHADMRAAVLGRQLTPIIPATRPDDIIGAGAAGTGRQPRARRVAPRVIAAAASIACIGVVLLLAWYPGKDSNPGNQVFHTATSAGSLEGIDYVLQLQFEEGVSDAESGRIASHLDGAVKWSVNDNGVYEVHVRLAAPSLQALHEYEKNTETLPGVQSARFTALQLPIR